MKSGATAFWCLNSDPRKITAMAWPSSTKALYSDAESFDRCKAAQDTHSLELNIGENS